MLSCTHSDHSNHSKVYSPSKMKVEDLVIENTPDAQIGTGSFGNVWKGTRSGSSCAVKVLHGVSLFLPLHGSIKSEKQEKFESECKFLHNIRTKTPRPLFPVRRKHPFPRYPEDEDREPLRKGCSHYEPEAAHHPREKTPVVSGEKTARTSFGPRGDKLRGLACEAKSRYLTERKLDSRARSGLSLRADPV